MGYCVEKFVTGLKWNANIPSDAKIIQNYAYQLNKDKGGRKRLELQDIPNWTPSHQGDHISIV